MTKIKGFLKLTWVSPSPSPPLCFFGYWDVSRDTTLQAISSLSPGGPAACLLQAGSLAPGCRQVIASSRRVARWWTDPLLPLSCSRSATSHWMNRVFWGSKCSSRAALHFIPVSQFQSTSATYGQSRGVQVLRSSLNRHTNSKLAAGRSSFGSDFLQLKVVFSPSRFQVCFSWEHQPPQLLKVARWALGAEPPYLPGSPVAWRGWRVSLGVSREVSAARRRSYLGALVQQRLCKRSADALRRTGYQRHFAVHVHCAAAARASPPPPPPQLLCSWCTCNPAQRSPASGRGWNCQANPGAPRTLSPGLKAPGRQAARSLPSWLTATSGFVTGGEPTGKAERLFLKKISLHQ